MKALAIRKRDFMLALFIGFVGGFVWAADLASLWNSNAADTAVSSYASVD